MTTSGTDAGQTQQTREQLIERIDELESYKHNADHALNLAIGEARLAEFAFAELRAVNERLVQDVKRHMEREEALRQALEEAAQSLRTIEQKAGKDEFLINIFDVRGYAYSRASAARAALEATEGDAPW